MERLRHRAGHALLALGLVAWVLGSFAGTLHEVLVAHVVCAEHGELVEVHHDEAVASADHEEGPSVGASHVDDDHDHGCATLLASSHGLPSAELPPPSRTGKPHGSLRVWAHASPRGPPLTWAPKTSPPLAS